jgi:hypothetical protein
MKLVGLVFLGLIASGIAYALLFLLLGLVFTNLVSTKMDENVGMIMGFLVILPLAFFLGSIVTGYFSYYDIEHKWSLLAMAPVLYLELAGVCVSVVGFLLDRFIDVNPPGPHFLRNILFPIGLGLYWYSASAGGVFLGYYLRERFAKWWYRD